MSARDDYPILANFRGAHQTGDEPYEIFRALAEIDRLRDQKSRLRGFISNRGRGWMDPASTAILEETA